MANKCIHNYTNKTIAYNILLLPLKLLFFYLFIYLFIYFPSKLKTFFYNLTSQNFFFIYIYIYFTIKVGVFYLKRNLP
ncbi:MAG: hypothetical protein N7Q72_02005, partial [Spiroplasma sp. Tabriz.8]|nr:hypothetical protein [Spiroplasma sp. Tabriz.8]